MDPELLPRAARSLTPGRFRTLCQTLSFSGVSDGSVHCRYGPRLQTTFRPSISDLSRRPVRLTSEHRSADDPREFVMICQTRGECEYDQRPQDDICQKYSRSLDLR